MTWYDLQWFTMMFLKQTWHAPVRPPLHPWNPCCFPMVTCTWFRWSVPQRFIAVKPTWNYHMTWASLAYSKLKSKAIWLWVKTHPSVLIKTGGMYGYPQSVVHSFWYMPIYHDINRNHLVQADSDPSCWVSHYVVAPAKTQKSVASHVVSGAASGKLWSSGRLQGRAKVPFLGTLVMQRKIGTPLLSIPFKMDFCGLSFKTKTAMQCSTFQADCRLEFEAWMMEESLLETLLETYLCFCSGWWDSMP